MHAGESGSIGTEDRDIILPAVIESGHSRFPVHGDDKDDILGILLAKDLLRGIVADGGTALQRCGECIRGFAK